MADFYCDVSAVWNEYQTYADTPTSWGVPQDGNGKASNAAAAAVAIATIDVAGCSASGNGTIGVLGVTVSSTLSGSGSTLASAIVTAINASATAVSSTYSALQLPLNRLVFARVNPAQDTQVQIMLRIAGIDWNGIAPTQANISPAATIGSFSGGADGPFGYLFNTSTVFGKSALAYGIWTAKPASVTEPGINDVIHLRTRRAGNNLTIAYTLNSAINIRHPTGSTRQFLADDGAVWSGDDGQLTLSLNCTPTYTSNSLYVNGFVAAKKKYGLRVYWTGSNTSNLAINNSNQPSERYCWQNVFFECSTASQGWFVSPLTANTYVMFKDCKFLFPTPQTFVSCSTGSGFYNAYCVLDGCEFSAISMSADWPQLISIMQTSEPTAAIVVKNCRFLGAFKTNVTNANYGNSSFRVFVENCYGINPVAVGATAKRWNDPANVTWIDNSNDRYFRQEMSSCAIEWIGEVGLPVQDATLPSGTLWAWKLYLRSAVTDRFLNSPVAKISKFYRGTDAYLTLSVDILCPEAMILNNSDAEMIVSYTDTSGSRQTERTSGAGLWTQLTGGTPLPSGSAWSQYPVGYSSNGARKFSLTTTNQVKQNTEISCEIVFLKSDSVQRVFYINPELRIA